MGREEVRRSGEVAAVILDDIPDNAVVLTDQVITSPIRAATSTKPERLISHAITVDRIERPPIGSVRPGKRRVPHYPRLVLFHKAKFAEAKINWNAANLTRRR